MPISQPESNKHHTKTRNKNTLRKNKKSKQT